MALNGTSDLTAAAGVVWDSVSQGLSLFMQEPLIYFTAAGLVIIGFSLVKRTVIRRG